MTTDGEGRERMLIEKDLIKDWGTAEAYYKEKERFLKEHERAESKTFTSDGLLVGVTYYFKPYQVAVENLELQRMLAQANNEARLIEED